LKTPLAERVAAGLGRAIEPEVSAAAARLARDGDTVAVLFYGSNLRTGSLDGVLDFYRLTCGSPERGIWPRVSFHELRENGAELRAKVATMTLAMFADAARGERLDTTVWARFTQPCALAWVRDEGAREATIGAVGDAVVTAARLAALVGPAQGREADFWTALFGATYQAELRVEPQGRAGSIVAGAAAHFDGLLTLAWEAGAVPFGRDGAGRLSPRLAPSERKRLMRWWRRRRRAGKALNLARLAKATTTFAGAARYGVWKIERHTGVVIPLTPWRERHPLLAAPIVFWLLWRKRRKSRVRDTAA
jgi:hypothetical protein